MAFSNLPNSIQSGVARALSGRRQGPGVTAGGLQDLPLPEPGLVRFRAVDHPDLGIVCELNGHVLPTGYAQHEVVGRQGYEGILNYTGREPLGLRIPLLLDRWTSRGTVEADIGVLERLHGLDDKLVGSPSIIVEGFGIPHSYSRSAQLRWVLTGDPDFDTENIRTRGLDGHRSYVPVVVTARCDTKPRTLTAPSSGTGARHTFTVQKGSKLNTLRAIAKHRHQDWKALRTLNPALPGDPAVTLKAGTKVRVS